MTTPKDLAELVEELRLIGCHANGDSRCTCGIGQDAADALEAQAEETRRLREALSGLEWACDQLASTRTHEVYLAMVDGDGGCGWSRMDWPASFTTVPNPISWQGNLLAETQSS